MPKTKIIKTTQSHSKGKWSDVKNRMFANNKGYTIEEKKREKNFEKPNPKYIKEIKHKANPKLTNSSKLTPSTMDNAYMMERRWK